MVGRPASARAPELAAVRERLFAGMPGQVRLEVGQRAVPAVM